MSITDYKKRPAEVEFRNQLEGSEATVCLYDKLSV